MLCFIRVRDVVVEEKMIINHFIMASVRYFIKI